MTGTNPQANEQLYIRFLKLVQAQKISPNGKELTPPEMHLLEDVALRTGASIDVVGDALIKLNKDLTDPNPDSEASKALRQIGLDAAELRKQDPADALKKVLEGVFEMRASQLGMRDIETYPISVALAESLDFVRNHEQIVKALPAKMPWKRRHGLRNDFHTSLVNFG